MIDYMMKCPFCPNDYSPMQIEEKEINDSTYVVIKCPVCGRIFYDDSIVEALEKANEQIEELETVNEELSSEINILKREFPSNVDEDDYVESEIRKITDPDE